MSKRKKSRKSSNRQARQSVQEVEASEGGSLKALLVILGVSIIGVAFLSFVFWPSAPTETRRQRERDRGTPDSSTQANSNSPRTAADTRSFSRGNLTMVWDSLTPDVLAEIKPTSEASSNIRPEDYTGPDACVSCHQENHNDWSEHSHRWMNALAEPENVRGNFENATIKYRGGIGTFYKIDGEFRMRFDRERSENYTEVHREYTINQTIGSRFYQYYVGKGLVGPETKAHSFYKEDFVLPFGFWLEKQAWVPIVHVAEEKREGERWESIESLRPTVNSIAHPGLEGVGVARGVIDHNAELGLVYAKSCNYCHTTFALGDMLVRNPKLVGPSLASPTIFEMSSFIADTRPDRWDGKQAPELLGASELQAMTDGYADMDARNAAVSLGISCEACHLGCLEHAKNESKLPAFKPLSPNLHEFMGEENLVEGRSQLNTNSACARCHVGNRPVYAAGMATWNSVELSDAMRGGCYSKLSCAHCHDPHKAIGKAWTKTPSEDDASCLSCHEKFEDAELRLSHTHHPAGSSGDRCMNCHMPKINEGMQDVVRTHMIYSPTQPDMLAANHPNACNLCHLEKSISWTVGHLQEWYGSLANGAAILQQLESPSQPAGEGWINGSHEATRLVASEAAATANAKWLLPEVIGMLDDPFLLNRQFAQKSVEALTESDLVEQFGYWYYHTKDERKEALEKIREQLLQPKN